MRFLPPLLANLAVALSAIGFGTLLRPLLDPQYSDLDRAALTLLGGLGILGTALFVVGQILFSRTIIVTVLLIGIALCFRAAYISRQRLRTLTSLVLRPVCPVIVVALVVVITILAGMALPVGDMNHDAIAYHYLGPRVWLQDGLIRAVPHEVLTYFPVLIEPQYAALMSLGGQRAPQFFSVIGLICLLCTTASLAARFGLHTAGVWWTLAVVATMPAAYIGAVYGYIDALFAAFALLAIRIAIDARSPASYALLGIFSGFCMAAKYTGIVTFAVLLCCLLLLFRSFRVAPGVFVRNLAIMVGVAVVCACPVYLRNWLLYGCPIYPPPPSLLRFFSPKDLSPVVLAEVLKNVQETGVGLGRSFWNFLSLPFNLTYHTSNFRGAGGIGLVPLALAPLGLWDYRKNIPALAVAFFGFLTTVAWFLTAQVSRYLIPVYVIGAAFGILGWKNIYERSPRLPKAFAILTIAASLAYGFAMILQSRSEDLHAALSSSFEEKRQQRETPLYESFQYINHEPAVKNVFVPNCGVATYFIDKLYTKPCGRWGERTLPLPNSSFDLVRQARALRATHILDVRDEGGFALPDPSPGTTKVFERDTQRIYRVD